MQSVSSIIRPHWGSLVGGGGVTVVYAWRRCSLCGCSPPPPPPPLPLLPLLLPLPIPPPSPPSSSSSSSSSWPCRCLQVAFQNSLIQVMRPRSWRRRDQESHQLRPLRLARRRTRSPHLLQLIMVGWLLPLHPPLAYLRHHLGASLLKE